MFVFGGVLAISVQKPQPTSLGHAAADICNDLELGHILADSHRRGKSRLFAFNNARFLSMIHDAKEVELPVDRFLAFNKLTKPCF